MRDFAAEYQRNIKFIDSCLIPLNQGVLKPIRPKSVLGWFFHIWPIWYGCIWLCVYTYLIFGQRAGLALISQQIWCMMCVTQLVAKLINGVVNIKKLKALFQWCNEVYTTKYDPEYQNVVNGVFEKTNIYITWAIR